MSEDYTYPPTPRMVRAEELHMARQDIARLLLLLDEAMTTTLPPWRERQMQQDADAIRDSWEVQP